MSARDFSVMPVLVIGQEPDSVTRAVRNRNTSCRPGDVVDVEFGATWATIRGKQQRIGGQWIPCRIVKIHHSELHVELLQTQRTIPVVECHCLRGWNCADHPEHPKDHPGCDGAAGVRCLNPECPYWAGDEPLFETMKDQ